MNWTMNTIARGLSPLAVVAALLTTTLARADEPASSPAADEEQAEPSRPVSKWIGVHCEPADDALTSQLGLKPDVGLVVRYVLKGSPAAKAGLQVNDVLTAVDGHPLKNIPGLLAAVNVAAEGPRHVELIRAGKHETIDVQPSARPQPSEPALESVVPDGFPQGLEFVHPGMIFQRDSAGGLKFTPAPFAELPDNVTVTITRTGKEQPQIKVERGDMTWNVTRNTLHELPPELQAVIAAMLPPRGQTMIGPFGSNPTRLPPGSGTAMQPDKALDRMQKQLEEMNRRLEELRQRLEPGAKDPPAKPVPPAKTEL
jgi:membrane-associated protease RseP (regulator of RpoE activity)